MIDGATFFAAERLKWSEREFQDEVVKLAREHRFLVYHTHDSRRSDPGFPDLVMAKPYRLIFAELKAEKGRTSPAQLHWIEQLMQATQSEVYLWRPSDWNSGEIQRVLA